VNLVRPLSLALFATILSACKLEIVVPEGGSVTSTSGGFDCSEGETCTFDVDDLSFSETFTGVGSGENRFLRWKKRKRGLCGGNTTPCELSTAPLASSPLLLAVLESDEKFYLEPVFGTSGGDPAVGTTPASVCFNDDLLTAGTTMEFRWRQTGSLVEGEQFLDIRQNVVGERGFQGQKALLINSETQTTQNGLEVMGTSEFYMDAQLNNKRAVWLGTNDKTFIDGVPTGLVESTYEPGWLDRYDLKPGESYTQEYVENYISDTGQLVIEGRSEVRLETRYVGVVSVTVPAGTFDACKFETVSTVTEQGNEFTGWRNYWVGVGFGLQVKDEAEWGGYEMMSGTINGASF
jgi:hypothetical protein